VPSWAKDSKNSSHLINARMETIQEKPSFRSALKHFRMTQSEGTLTLVANNQNGSEPAIAPAISQPVNNTPTIRKAVICDKNNNCKTTYSDR